MAIVSTIRNWKRKKLYKNANNFEDITWREFESLIAEYFQQQGYSVRENVSGGPDGGIDLRLKKSRKTYSVQCKHWNSEKVGVNVIREQYGIMMADSFDGAFVVTSGNFTKEAVFFANKTGVNLMDGRRLRDILKNISNPSSQERNEKKKSWLWYCAVTFLSIAVVVLIYLVLNNYKSFKPMSYVGTSTDNTEEVIINKTIPDLLLEKLSPDTKEVQRYLYMIRLKNGGMIRATSVNKVGNTFSIKNDSGLVMVISAAEIENMKKIEL